MSYNNILTKEEHAAMFKNFDSLEEFIFFEENLFNRNLFMDYKHYKLFVEEGIQSANLPNDFSVYIRNKKRNIAVYPGSFNPFHEGHLSILEKAEAIFDKVILARGINPDKKNELWDIPNVVKDRQIENYSGLLTDFIDGLGYDVTVIRGLRNSTDLQYEMTQYEFLKDLKPNIKVVSIFCDPHLAHISSSSIRMLKLYNKHEKYIL